MKNGWYLADVVYEDGTELEEWFYSQNSGKAYDGYLTNNRANPTEWICPVISCCNTIYGILSCVRSSNWFLVPVSALRLFHQWFL